MGQRTFQSWVTQIRHGQSPSHPETGIVELFHDESRVVVDKRCPTFVPVGGGADIHRFPGDGNPSEAVFEAIEGVGRIGEFDNGRAAPVQDTGNFAEFSQGSRQVMHDPNQGDQVNSALVERKAIGPELPEINTGMSTHVVAGDRQLSPAWIYQGDPVRVLGQQNGPTAITTTDIERMTEMSVP